MSRAFFRASLAAFLCAAPFAQGVVPDRVLHAYVGVSLAAVAYAAAAWGRWRLADRASLGLLSAIACVSASDLVLRPLTATTLYYRPDEMSIHAWPPMPALARYAPHFSFRGRTYGDLAAKTGNSAWRDYREVGFRTDEWGYRNEPGMTLRTNDVILLGDSFGVGTGTSQEQTLASDLEQDAHLRIYNLSMTGNPYQELMALKVSEPSLRLAPHAMVLWLLFSGNDLFGDFGDRFDVTSEPWHRQVLTRLHTFQNRSPLREYMRRWAMAWKTSAFKPQVVAKPLPNGRTMLFYEPYLWLRKSVIEDVKGAENYPKFRATLAAMSDYAHERNLRVLVAVAPTKAEIYAWVVDGSAPASASYRRSGFAAAVEEICRERDMPCVDLAPGLLAASSEAYAKDQSLLWWLDDTHWNDRGQAIAAGILAQSLLQPTR